MATSNTYSKIKIIKGFEEDEIEEFYTKILSSGYLLDNGKLADLTKESFTKHMDEDCRYLSFTGLVSNSTYKQLEEFLMDTGMPFKCLNRKTKKGYPDMVIFDGVRRHYVNCTKNEEPLAPMAALREVINLLELSEEEDQFADMKALVVANENWVETDINNMWRYGMENSVAFSSNFRDPNADAIDVDIEEEVDGNPEITKKVNS